MKVLSWHPEANHLSRDLSRPAHGVFNRFPVGRRRWRLRSCECCRQKKNDGAYRFKELFIHAILHISSYELQRCTSSLANSFFVHSCRGGDVLQCHSSAVEHNHFFRRFSSALSPCHDFSQLGVNTLGPHGAGG